MALTDKDLQAINKIFRSVFKDMAEEIGLVTKKDISHLPTKDEFYQEMDKIAGEYQKFNQEAPAHVSKISDLETRVDRLESHLNLQSN